mmetsp:Transcript_8237/g.17560  ORF Transcript_8237/g.17560 Transcript_8237/m.17560 type:complete len:509 (-) Transcript_8237:122-1648(-)|eukprot:CAMPEP_0171344446 /NCGR_PEP_ID=MMETSP0878-20121228/19383_1 /TAXON_ID=67004 /ORGANISM="Thalassiosira weissflogii, Strain CCMP1336" /LENGTH=508 /DNA_ID=CAMNT_0011847635 /DNA_START=100 /DNA_END=1626 /DNA_ORIENTATION=+
MWKRKPKQNKRDTPQLISAYPTPPPISEQKILRQKDPSIVPLSPYLLLSKAIDITCDYVPLLRDLCPAPWRSSLPYDWGTFPHGRLSHSYILDVQNELDRPDVDYPDFLASSSSLPLPDGTSPYPTDAIQKSLGNMYTFAFHTSNTTLSDLSHPVALTTLLFLVFTLRSIKKLLLPKFSSLGRRLGRSAHGPGWETTHPERIQKFGEYVYRLIYHSLISVYGVLYFWNKPWWKAGGTKHLFLGLPNHDVEPGMAWYYLVQCAYNVDALVSLVELSFSWTAVNPLCYSSALEWHGGDKLKKEKNKGINKTNNNGTTHNNHSNRPPKPLLWTPFFRLTYSPTIRGDFREMMAHHLVTNALIFGSSYYRLTRIGSMIFLIHDISDVPIDMSKLANFVKWKVTTIVCFVIMVIMWLVTRLTIFPFVICKSALLESYEYLVVQGHVDPALYEACYLFFYALLGCLVLLHVTWFLILLRIGWTLVSRGERHDYTEHKSGEDQGVGGMNNLTKVD